MKLFNKNKLSLEINIRDRRDLRVYQLDRCGNENHQGAFNHLNRQSRYESFLGRQRMLSFLPQTVDVPIYVPDCSNTDQSNVAILTTC